MGLRVGRLRPWGPHAAGLAVLVGLTALAGSWSGVSATSFQPTWNTAVNNPEPGAASDIILELSIPAPEPNFSRLVAFIPPEFAVADGDEIPNGAYTGAVTANATLGLIGNPCSSALEIQFQMMDASTNPDVWGHPYYGTEDSNGDGLPDNVDLYPYPMQLIAPGIEPVQRLYGQALVAGRQIPLNFVIFAPGTPIALLPAFDASLGYPTVTIVGDPFADPETNFPITDFCTPLSTTVVLSGSSADNPALPGEQGGLPLRRNPSVAGVYNSIIFARSQWDADGDGIENNIDPCALTPDPGWNPRAEGGPGDVDGDGLPDSCDPSAGAMFDSDEDGYPNRGDYCPTVAANFIHRDMDRDAIGDECDPFPTDDTNGGASQRMQVCVGDTLVVGSPASLEPSPWSCPGGPDLQVPPRMNLYYAHTQTVGTPLAVVVQLTTPGLIQGPAEGVTVDFVVTGANSTSGSCVTEPGGVCEFEYVGASEGTDTITATATVGGFTIDDTVSVTWVLPPPNDDFAAAIPVSGLPFEAQVPLVGATREPNEPVCGWGGTLWYSFTPADTAYVVVETDSQWDTVSLSVYEGSTLAGLQRVACREPGIGDDISAAGASIGFAAEAGQTYHLQVVPGGPFGGPVLVRIEHAAPGDANCSADLTVLDVLAVLRLSAGTPAADCAGNGDINCSGEVDARDALEILRVAAAVAEPPGSC